MLRLNSCQSSFIRSRDVLKTVVNRFLSINIKGLVQWLFDRRKRLEHLFRWYHCLIHYIMPLWIHGWHLSLWWLPNALRCTCFLPYACYLGGTWLKSWYVLVVCLSRRTILVLLLLAVLCVFTENQLLLSLSLSYHIMLAYPRIQRVSHPLQVTQIPRRCLIVRLVTLLTVVTWILLWVIFFFLNVRVALCWFSLFSDITRFLTRHLLYFPNARLLLHV